MSETSDRKLSQVTGPDDPTVPSVPPTAGGPGNITGLVFNDTNLNGILEPNESPVSGAAVALVDANTGAAVQTVTDATGTYSFTGVLPSSYTLRTAFELPQTQTNASPIILISPDPAEPLNNVIVNLGSTVPENVGNVAGVKYFDANGNGLLDPGEPGIPNFTIYADINYNGILDIEDRFTVTTEGGQYFLANLPATRLQIREFQLPGVSQTNNPSPVVDIIPGQTIAGVNIPSGETFAGIGSSVPITNGPVNFGNTPQVAVVGQIGGTVFNDLNGNGQAEPGEPGVPGAALYIDSNGNSIQEPAERTTITDDNGRYSFPGLFIDSFIVREVPPIGFAKNIPDPVVTLTVENPVNDAVNFANVAVPIPPPPPVPVAPPPTVAVAPPPTEVPQPEPAAEPAAEPEPEPAPEPEPEPAAEAAPEPNGEATAEPATTEPATTEPATTEPATAEPATAEPATTDEGIQAARTASQTADGTGSIAGTVFQDFNANQAVDVDEPGAAGITVYLDTNNNNLLDEGEATSISDAEGKYAFGGLPPGNYVVQVNGVTPTTPPAVITLVSGDDANFVNIGVPGIAPPPGPVPPVPPPGPVPPEVVVPPVAIPDPFGIQAGAITGGKFDDLNGNGFFEPDEPVKPGVTIYLDLNDSGQLEPGEPNTVTDINGQYRFDNVPAGIYRVREILQPGEIQTSIDPRVIVVPGQEITYNFANTTIFGQPEFSSSISGVAFEDVNGDRSFEPGVDPGVPGIQIYLDINASGELDPEEPVTFTDEGGEYIFRAVPPGTYTVRQNLAGFEGQIEQIVPDPTVDSGQTVTVTVPNDNPSGINFINAFQSAGANTISGIAFNDLNGNQLFEPFAGETGIPGIEVYLDTSGDGVPQGFEPNQITGAGGAYELDVSGLSGSYKLQAFLRGGFFQTTSDVVIDTPAGQSLTYNFGLAPEGIVSGKVFEDFNGNGLLDPGEPIGIPEVQIYVDLNNNGVFDPVEPNTFSNINGDYGIVGLKTPGTYTIRQIPRADLVKTTPDATLEVGLNQNITFNIGNSRIEGGAPPAGGDLTSIGGTVFEDRNSNQLVDPDEPGLAGFTVYLDLNENATLDEGEPSSVTDAEGRYDFVNLPVRQDDSGNLLPYVVRQVQQPGFTQTTPDPVVTLVAGESANFVNIGNAPGVAPPPDPLTNPGATAPPEPEVITASSSGGGIPSGNPLTEDQAVGNVEDPIIAAAADTGF